MSQHMWSEIMEAFDDQPAKQQVVEFLLRHGYSVTEEAGINANGVEITNTALAAEVGVDRRVVSKTVDQILSTPELREVFENLSFVPFLEEEAPVLGLSVVTVEVSEAAEAGLLADIAAVFRDHDVMIRQAVVEDPFFTRQPQFVGIVDDTIPGGLLTDLSELPFVTDVSYSGYGS